MGNITVAVLRRIRIQRNIGKKGTSTDITFYNLKKGEDTVTLIEPERYPERLAPLFYAVSLSKAAIVVVDQIDATFGECLVMLQCCRNKKRLFYFTKLYSQRKNRTSNQRNKPGKIRIPIRRPNGFKRKTFGRSRKTKTSRNICWQPVTGTVPVDHAFNVKGVGVVVLGVVASGIVQKHQL